jgi:predicted DNA-binding transcriptional regulator
MEKDRLIGAGILAASVVIAIVYALLLYLGYGSILVLILVSIGFFVLLGILGWIGWTIATTPVPKLPELESIEEIESVEKKGKRGRPRKRKG